MDVDAISAMFPYREEFLRRVERFVRVTTSTSPEIIEEFDQKVNSNIQIKGKTHLLHHIQHVCIDNLRTMLYLEKARWLNPGQHSDACYNSAKNLNNKVLKSFPDNFNALYNKLMLPDTNGSVARGGADEGDIIVYMRPTVMDELKRVAEDDNGSAARGSADEGDHDCMILYKRPTIMDELKKVSEDTNGSVARGGADEGDHDHIIVYMRPTVMDELKRVAEDDNGSVARRSADEGDHDCIILYKRPTIMDELKRVAEDDKLMLIAKAEVAGMYTYLEIDSESLQNSVNLYEEVLDQIDASTGSCDIQSLDRLIVFWKQDLLWHYKQLTYEHIQHDRALSGAKTLAADLDQSPIVDNKLKAQAWANLASIFEYKMPTYHKRCSYENESEGKQRRKECLEKAMRLDPSNARIHMQAARELRKRDRTKTSQLRAIELFSISLNGEDSEDIRGFILFHMGLTFKQLWIDADHPRYDVTVNAGLRSEISRHSQHPHYKAPVIKPPNLPSNFDDIPPPYKRAHNSVYWRFLNPIACDRNSYYLVEARRCFREACESETEDEKRCQFLIELSRTYISTGDIEAARECLQRAQRDPCSDMVSVEFVGVSLHENMGFLEESEMMRRAMFNDAEVERIKSLYRESIRQSTQSGWKPVVAFHCLLALLYKQLETRSAEHLPEVDQTVQHTDHMILQNEYFLLYMAIQEAKDSRDIVNSLATDNFKIALMWKLIEMFNRRNREYDAAAAFTYLSILAVAGLITEEVGGINFTAVEKQRMLLVAAERVARQRVSVAETRYLLSQYRELNDFCDAHQEPGAHQHVVWSIVYRRQSLCSSSESLSDYENEKLNIVMKIIKPDLPRHFYGRKFT